MGSWPLFDEDIRSLKIILKTIILFQFSFLTVNMFHSFSCKTCTLSCTPLRVHFLPISSYWGVTIVIIQLLRGLTHRFTKTTLDQSNGWKLELATGKSYRGERKRLYDFVVVPFDFVPFSRFVVLMHYLKCTKRAVVKTLQYGVRVHDYRPNIEQYYPLVGKILVKIFSKCESFRSSNRYARR